MTQRQIRLQILWAALVASLLAIGIARLSAEDCDQDDPNSTCFYIYRPGLCQFLQPETYWWGFWGCEQMQSERETVHWHFQPDGRVFVEIVREYPDGRRATLIRELRGGQ